MARYLFKITTTVDVWASIKGIKPRVVYLSADTFEDVKKWSKTGLNEGVMVKNITCVATTANWGNTLYVADAESKKLKKPKGLLNND